MSHRARHRERRYTRAVQRQAEARAAWDRAGPLERLDTHMPADVSEVLRPGDSVERHLPEVTR